MVTMSAGALASGSETILIVEDELAVRRVARLALQRQGYTVLEAAGGADAERVAAGHPGQIHLLLTDVVMPGMGGPVLAEKLRASRPKLRVLYMSGYLDDEIVRHGVPAATEALIPKPFSPDSLARKVRAMLDEAES
ncbi:MAG TPA: response regulator [Gemmataceae bacterium]|nr:response regulator [Gemmataceae bacterium]